MRGRLRGTLFWLLTLGVLGWAAARQIDLPAPRFVPQAITPGITPATAAFHADFIPSAPGAPAVHAATLVRLKDGTLMAAWFGGSHEAAPDVKIYAADYANGHWSTPRALTGRHRTQQAVQRMVRMIGNPLLFHTADGALNLLYVSVGIGGWSGSALNLMRSTDGGLHFDAPRRLVLTPLLNISTLVKQDPQPLADGSIAIPIYNESMGIFPEWLRLSRHGEVLGKYRIAGGKDLLQPALVPLTTQHVLAFMRYKGPAPHRVMRAESVDGGQHWSTPTATDVPNPNSAVAVLRLRDGRLLMAANPIRSNRNVLALLISRDDGRHWQRIVTLEEGGSEAEFSYPYMIRSGDRIDLAYTWRRKRIRHVRFNLNWLNGKARAAQRDPAAADRPIFQESGS